MIFLFFFHLGGKGAPKMDADDLSYHCTSFFLDAIVSTSHLILWNLLYLARYPAMQSKIQKELDQVYLLIYYLFLHSAEIIL